MGCGEQSAAAERLWLRRAVVLTMDPARPAASAIGIAGGRILAVGDDEEVAVAIGPGAAVVDCAGGSVVPGFIDPHVHLLALARSLSSIDLSPPAVDSIAGLVAALRAGRRAAAGTAWLRGHGYDDALLAERRHPTRWDLDAVAVDRPIRIRHRTRHASVLNGAAIDWIRARAPDLLLASGVERRARDQAPTGVFYELEREITALVPKPSAAEALAALGEASDLLLGAGVTAIDDVSASTGAAEANLLRAAVGTGRVRQRLRLFWGAEGSDPPAAVDVVGIKLMLDEQAEPGSAFIPRLEAAHRRGFQIAVHAVEGSAIAIAVAAFEHALGRWPRPHRHRIEHGALCPPPLMDRLARLGLTVVTQPAFIAHAGERYADLVAPSERRWLYPLRTFARRGVSVAASSDAPVGPVAPLAGVAAAMHRRTRGGRPLNPTEALPFEAALGLYTRAAARACASEETHGAIMRGRVADLVVLDRDLTRVPAVEIDAARIRLVVVGGHPVKPGALGDRGPVIHRAVA
jgi:hypothetical protein